MVSRERESRSRVRKRTVVIIAGVLLGAAFLGALIIPLYTYPGQDWNSVIAAKGANPSVSMVVIINPNSGPGTASDPNYVAGINSLRAANVTVLGYDHTSYGARALSTVEADMNSYKAWYPNINGFFFDEMANTPGYETYYSALTAYAKTLGYDFTVGNPGSAVPASYIGTVNVIVTDENAGIPSNASLASWTAGMPKNNFAVIAYGVSPSSVTSANIAGVFQYANYIYVTNETTPNPYANLGTEWTGVVSYLSNHVTPPTTIPLTVESVNKATGIQVTGIYTTVLGSNGVTQSGYTPLTEQISAGSSYTVTVSNYGQFVFSQWASGGSTSMSTSVKETQAATLVADYSATGTTTTTTSSHASTSTHITTTTTIHTSDSTSIASSHTGAVSVTVRTESLSGTTITGLWTVVTSSGGSTVASGYSPLTFQGTTGSIYTITVDNYGSDTFVHWDNGLTNPTRPTTVGTSNAILTAYFNT
jgi:Spherulation-specific family 4